MTRALVNEALCVVGLDAALNPGYRGFRGNIGRQTVAQWRIKCCRIEMCDAASLWWSCLSLSPSSRGWSVCLALPWYASATDTPASNSLAMSQTKLKVDWWRLRNFSQFVRRTFGRMIEYSERARSLGGHRHYCAFMASRAKALRNLGHA
ncbi:hypothetical protein BH10PLA2_BH10PLA2_30770 [soil metagenome]